MRIIILSFAVFALAGCGVDSMSAAATGAAVKKQEIEQGRKSMEQAEQKIAQAMKQAEERTQKATEAAGQ